MPPLGAKPTVQCSAVQCSAVQCSAVVPRAGSQGTLIQLYLSPGSSPTVLVYIQCMHCINCMHCNDCIHCAHCIHCIHCTQCVYCIHCIHCMHCMRCMHCICIYPVYAQQLYIQSYGLQLTPQCRPCPKEWSVAPAAQLPRCPGWPGKWSMKVKSPIWRLGHDRAGDLK
jgi:hypothetical protein